MTKIKNTIAYKIKRPLSLSDYAAGTNNEDGVPGFSKGQTISMELSEMRELFLAGLNPELGGTLKISEIEYEGVLTSPAAVANALDPAYEVVQYEVLILNVNGNKYLLKEQDLTIGVAQPDVTDADFINVVAFTKLGNGTAVLKGYNATSGNWEFYAIKSTGNDVSVVSNNVVIDPKAGTNLGAGQAVYKGLNSTTKLHEFYNLKSNTQIITLVGNDVFIDDAATATIPALYVNNLYEPTYDDWVAAGGNLLSNPSFDYKGEGTLAKPFTDTVRYTSTIAKTTTANTAIQNALDAYVGSGTRLSPELVGQKIIIQDNNSDYTFSGDFGYSRLEIEQYANVNHTGTGMFFDMDNATHFNASQDTITIIIGENYFLTSESNGFNNSGTTTATNNLSFSRVANLLGSGTIYFPNENTTKYIINSDVSNTGNNNDGGITFNIECNIRADYQGLVKIGGVSRVYNYGQMQSGVSNVTINSSLKAFLLIGGQFRNFKTSSFSFGGGNRTDGFTFTPTGGFEPSLIVQSSTIISQNTITNLFNKTNNNAANLTFVNSDSSVLFNVTNIFESTNLWPVNFNRNIFATGSIDSTKADLTNSNTTSVSNSIGGNLIETLVQYGSRALAAAGGLTKGCKFINRKTITAGSFVVGVEYRILTVGTTDFTLIGASANTVGINFTASGVGSGTGTAYQYAIDILI